MLGTGASRPRTLGVSSESTRSTASQELVDSTSSPEDAGSRGKQYGEFWSRAPIVQQEPGGQQSVQRGVLEGGRPFQGAEPRPGHGLPDAKCRFQWQL